MKSLFLAFLLFSSPCVFSQLNVSLQWVKSGSLFSADMIPYEQDNKLEWPDFQGRPDQHSVAGAITSSGFGYQASIWTKNGAGTLTVSVYCYFDKAKSWVKSSSETDYALTHEQHHFDVAYIATCLFFEKVRAASFTTSNYNVLLEKIYKDCTREMETMQDDYDGETHNGQVKDKQAEWNKKIDRLIAGLPRG